MDTRGAILLGVATVDELAAVMAMAAAQEQEKEEKFEDEFMPGYL